MKAQANPAFGKQVKEQDMVRFLMTGPNQFIVRKTLMQMAKVEGYRESFGPLKLPESDEAPLEQNQRWADYARSDWSIRQLPVINVYEADVDTTTSDQGWITGAVNMMVLWPPSFRRSDLARVPAAFVRSMQNFFASELVTKMLDEIYWHTRPEKVPALNEYGKELTWTPNVEGMVESELVPVTMVTAKYRCDRRAWYRWLEFQDRTKAKPFEKTLHDLTTIQGVYVGVTDTVGKDKVARVHDSIPVSSKEKCK